MNAPASPFALRPRRAPVARRVAAPSPGPAARRLGGRALALFALLEPVVRSFCPAFARQPYPVRRYLCDPA